MVQEVVVFGGLFFLFLAADAARNYAVPHKNHIFYAPTPRISPLYVI
jgi:hypothetical protein